MTLNEIRRRFPHASLSFISKNVSPAMGGLLPAEREGAQPDNSLRLRAMALLAEIPESDIVCRGKHTGEPMAKERPRISPRGHAYTPSSTKQHQKALAASIDPPFPECRNSEIAVGIRAVFFVQTYLRKDVDNLLKTLLDALSKLVFRDDSQVKELMGWQFVDFQNPRTEFVVYQCGIIDKDQGYCVQCGSSFRRFRSWKNRLFCSRACWAISQRNAVVVKCSGCGKEVLKIPSALYRENYCCAKCKVKARAIPCPTCGKLFTTAPSTAQKFCSKPCYNASRIGTKAKLSQQELSDRSMKGWKTRKMQCVRCKFCGAELIRDHVGQRCPTPNCQWQHGVTLTPRRKGVIVKMELL